MDLAGGGEKSEGSDILLFVAARRKYALNMPCVKFHDVAGTGDHASVGTSMAGTSMLGSDAELSSLPGGSKASKESKESLQSGGEEQGEETEAKAKGRKAELSKIKVDTDLKFRPPRAAPTGDDEEPSDAEQAEPVAPGSLHELAPGSLDEPPPIHVSLLPQTEEEKEVCC